MPQTIWHRFSGELLMLFQMVCLVLLTVLHFKTLLLIGCKFSTANQNPRSKGLLMARKRAERSTPSKRALKTEIVCGILFDLIYCMTSSASLKSLLICSFYVSCFLIRLTTKFLKYFVKTNLDFLKVKLFFQATSPKPPMLPPGASGQPIQQDQQQWKPPGIQGQPGISQGRQTLFSP